MREKFGIRNSEFGIQSSEFRVMSSELGTFRIPNSELRILVLIIFLLFFTACKERGEISTQNIERETSADEIIHNFTMVSTIGENQDWIMKATYFERFTKDRRWVAFDVFMETLNEDEKNFYSSDSLFVSEVTEIYTGMGNVEIISPNGILHTDKIIWDRKTDRIHAPNDVYIKNENHEIWGSVLYTNSNMDFVDLKEVSGIGSGE